MGLRGAPALATAATMFMGQVEGPIFIRGYLTSLSRSGLFLLLTVGMSCVAGSTLVAYATILHGVVPDAAAHVLTASLISAPAGVLLARILVPRDPAAEAPQDLDLNQAKSYESSIDALMKGTSDGLTMVLAIGATLVVFVALIAIADGLLGTSRRTSPRRATRSASSGAWACCSRRWPSPWAVRGARPPRRDSFWGSSWC